VRRDRGIERCDQPARHRCAGRSRVLRGSCRRRGSTREGSLAHNRRQSCNERRTRAQQHQHLSSIHRHPPITRAPTTKRFSFGAGLSLSNAMPRRKPRSSWLLNLNMAHRAIIMVRREGRSFRPCIHPSPASRATYPLTRWSHMRNPTPSTSGSSHRPQRRC
jgi:hypothetical protein